MFGASVESVVNGSRWCCWCCSRNQNRSTRKKRVFQRPTANWAVPARISRALGSSRIRSGHNSVNRNVSRGTDHCVHVKIVWPVRTRQFVHRLSRDLRDFDFAIRGVNSFLLREKAPSEERQGTAFYFLQKDRTRSICS